eukprot:g10035.t1
MFVGKFPDESNFVRGKTREKLKKAIEAARKFLSDDAATQNVSERAKARCGLLEDVFSNKRHGYRETLRAFVVDRNRSTGAAQAYMTEFGKVYSPEHVMRTIDAVHTKHVALVGGGLSAEHPFAFAHLAYLLWQYQDGTASRNHPSGWPEAVQALGASLFAQVYPEEAGRRAPVSKLSGFRIEQNRDDKQYILHFFDDLLVVDASDVAESAPKKKKDGRSRGNRQEQQHEDHSGRCRLTSARVALLGDGDDGEIRAQMIDVHPPLHVDDPNNLFSACERRFLVLQHPNFVEQFEVERCAFLSYRIIPVATTMAAIKEELQSGRLPCGSSLPREMLRNETDDASAARDVFESMLDSKWHCTKKGRSSFCTKADIDWLVDIKQRNGFAFFGGVSMGAGSRYAAPQNEIRIDSPEAIELILKMTNNTYDGYIPFLPAPALTVEELALEGFFWDAIEAGKQDLDGPEVATLAVMMLEGTDDNEISRLAANKLDEKAESGTDEENAERKQILHWLRDKKILTEQRKRAEWIQNEWRARGGETRKPGPHADFSKPSARSFSLEETTTSTQRESESTKTSTSAAIQRLEDSLEYISRKRMKFRQVIRGANLLRRAGVIEFGKDGVRVLTHGSHMVFHGPKGATTLVREHKSSARITAPIFMRKMHSLMDIAADVQLKL